MAPPERTSASEVTVGSPEVSSVQLKARFGSQFSVRPALSSQASALLNVNSAVKHYVVDVRDDTLDVICIASAFHKLAASRDVLRTTFFSTPDAVVQIVRQDDLQRVHQGVGMVVAKLEEFLQADMDRNFVFGEYWTRVTYVMTPSGVDHVVLTAHAALLDDKGMALLVADLLEYAQG
ncbi:hypothetical protein AC1031_004568 [Aphanomyces cochlioides]|nr:hypothetical protein AC1031_004568 [Aphanomyces cochlioides]